MLALCFIPSFYFHSSPLPNMLRSIYFLLDFFFSCISNHKGLPCHKEGDLTFSWRPCHFCCVYFCHCVVVHLYVILWEVWGYTFSELLIFLYYLHFVRLSECSLARYEIQVLKSHVPFFHLILALARLAALRQHPTQSLIIVSEPLSLHLCTDSRFGAPCS